MSREGSREDRSPVVTVGRPEAICLDVGVLEQRCGCRSSKFDSARLADDSSCCCACEDKAHCRGDELKVEAGSETLQPSLDARVR